MTTTPATARRRFATAVALVLTVSACGSGEAIVDEVNSALDEIATSSSVESSPSVSTTTGGSDPAPTTSLDPSEPEFRMPLTGEPLESADQIPNRPALAIKIPNNPQALPQAGLNEADIVYEEIINDRITRFAAVFHSEGSEPVGPIRSGRAQDVDLLSNLNSPLFAWSGGNAGVTRAVNSSSLTSLSYVGGYGNSYYRRDGRGGAPHNLFSDTATLWELAPDDFALPTPIFPYRLPGEEGIGAGEPATEVEVTMDSILARWNYDADSGRYLRTQYGEAHMTELTGQVWADNLVVLFADYRPGLIDAKSPEAQTVGSGPLIIFEGGRARHGIWTREANTDPFSFRTDPTESAPTLGLNPGRTFVEIPRNDPENVSYTGA